MMAKLMKECLRNTSNRAADRVIKICQLCKKEFKTRKRKAKYCSIECIGKAFRKKIKG